MISFIIPAHNEAALIRRTLAALHSSAQAAGEPYEVIVVDDASTDGTSSLAREQGARVVVVNLRRIAATRNAGAREAVGELLFFVDADTVVPARALRTAVQSLRNGAVGGGARVRFDGPVPLYAAILERVILPVLLPLLKIAPGCFLFCTRYAYVRAGGFDESLGWSEEVAFGSRLKLDQYRLEAVHVLNPTGRHFPALLQWPCFLDDIPRVFTKFVLQLRADRLGITAHIAVERGQRCGFFGNDLLDIGIGLPDADGDQRHSQAVEDHHRLHHRSGKVRIFRRHEQTRQHATAYHQ